MLNPINTCDSLELRPLDNVKNEIKWLIEECQKSNTAPQEFNEYMGELIEEVYEPYCKKRMSPCIVLESPVLSQRIYGFGNFHQPTRITLAKSREMTECSDRELSEGHRDGIESLEVFLLTHINTD
jgi:hypothetical protein